uniref:PTTG1 interacting protein n=1 Tax=Ficedula albicollis TaxID=59894 RepID=A0A803WE25_FICAL
MEYPVRRILPPADLCELRSARWGVCWGNKYWGCPLIVWSSSDAAMCCCRTEPDKDDERAARERERRRVRQEERRAEMKSRHDEIRRKYGTVLT